MARSKWVCGLATLVMAAVVPVPASAAVAVALVSSSPAQTIDNIGAWWVNDLARFPAATRQRVADLLFGADGIRLSVYRYNIGGGGVGVAVGDRAPQTPLTSPGSYDWSP